jgi:hypothetical protein
LTQNGIFGLKNQTIWQPWSAELSRQTLNMEISLEAGAAREPRRAQAGLPDFSGRNLPNFGKICQKTTKRTH